MNRPRPVWIAKTCGIHVNDVKDWEKEIASLSLELSEEEKKSPYAHYYYRGWKMPTHENLAAAENGNPLPRELAMRPEEFVQRVDSPEIEYLKSGYCLLEDGIGFSLARVEMKGITDEKFAYFNDNFNPEGDLHYKCWCPGMHMKHYIQGAVEDVGLGMELIQFLVGFTAQDLSGIEGYKVKDPGFIGFWGGGGISWPLHNLFHNPRYALEVTWWRDLPDGTGREVLVATWYGLKWENGKPVRAIPEGETVNIAHVRAQMSHAVLEFTQMAALIGLFWDEHH